VTSITPGEYKVSLVTDRRHDQVELNHISHQSGQGGGRGVDTHASRQRQGGGGGSSFCDGLAVADGNSSKVHATGQVRSSPLKIELIPGSHRVSNS